MGTGKTGNLNLTLAWVIVATLAGGFMIYLLAPILTPFLVSALLAYLGSPFLSRLQRLGVPRTLGVVIVFALIALFMLLVLLVLIPQVQRQLVVFAGKLPGYIDWLYAVLAPWLQTTLNLDASVLDMEAVKSQLTRHWRELGDIAGPLFSYLTRSGMSFVMWTVNLALIPVVTFYLMRDWDEIMQRVQNLLPPKTRPSVGVIARETDEVLASFMRGQLSVMLVLATVYSTGLWLVGLDLALPIGLLAGTVSFVPYLGFIIGILVAGVAAMLQFQDPMVLMWVALVFGTGQLLEAMVLTPYLVGGRIGLHPVAVIFSVMAGGQLFGFFGVLLALPSAAAIMVWLRHLHRRYTRSSFYKQPARRPRRT